MLENVTEHGNALAVLELKYNAKLYEEGCVIQTHAVNIVCNTEIRITGWPDKYDQRPLYVPRLQLLLRVGSVGSVNYQKGMLWLNGSPPPVLPPNAMSILHFFPLNGKNACEVQGLGFV
jgi:hypothetical protein